MDPIALALAGGWTSGISAYATVLVLGLLGRFGDVEGIPAALQRTDVLIVVAVLTAIEFFADKIAYVDSVWDAVHTVIRPVVAAGLGALVAGDASNLQQAAVAGLAAGVALLTHGTKAGLRAAVNTSPEPASNVVVSTVEDISLVGVLLLATQAPWAAAALAMAFLITGMTVVWWLWAKIRSGFRRTRRNGRQPAEPAGES